jgi:hypothetical protein
LDGRTAGFLPFDAKPAFRFGVQRPVPADRKAEALMPYGTTTTGHAWLHGECWPDWLAARKAEAAAALMAMGIKPATEAGDDLITVGKAGRLD